MKNNLLWGSDTPLKKMYLAEVQAELSKSIISHEVYKEEDIANLPSPVQRYFKYCGFIGKEKMANAEIVWDDVNFRMSPKKPWIKVRYEQINFVSEPARLAYINSTMYGVISFEGRDKYLSGQGNMLGKLLRIVTIFDAIGPEIDISAAVTYLSESLILPTCALQPYIRWEDVDLNHARASFEYKGVKAECVFTFNDKGEVTKFETDERYAYIEGTTEKHRWTVEMSNYIENNGIKSPSRAKVLWNLPGGDWEYFNGTLKHIIYNSTKNN